MLFQIGAFSFAYLNSLVIGLIFLMFLIHLDTCEDLLHARWDFTSLKFSFSLVLIAFLNFICSGRYLCLSFPFVLGYLRYAFCFINFCSSSLFKRFQSLIFIRKSLVLSYLRFQCLLFLSIPLCLPIFFFLQPFSIRWIYTSVYVFCTSSLLQFF